MNFPPFKKLTTYTEEGNTIATDSTSHIETIESGVSNLLAIIHSDGGHHESKVGTLQALKDAIGLMNSKWIAKTAEDVNVITGQTINCEIPKDNGN